MFVSHRELAGAELVVAPETGGVLFMFRPWQLVLRLPAPFLATSDVSFDDINRSVASAFVVPEQAAAARTPVSDVGPCRRCLASGIGAGTLEQRRKSILSIATPFKGTPQLLVASNTVEFAFEGCKSLCPSTLTHWGHRLCLVVSGIRGVLLVSAPFELRSRWKGRLPPPDLAPDTTAGYALFVAGDCRAISEVERPLAMPAFFVAVLCSTNLTKDGADIVNAHLTATFAQLPEFVGHNVQWRPQGLLLGVGQYRSSSSALESIQLGDCYVEASNPWHTDLRTQGALVILNICNSW